MTWQVFATIFGSVFVAELGDKTQLATMLFAAREGTSRWGVFAAAAAALVASTALAVVAGKAITAVVGENTLRWVAGIAFMIIEREFSSGLDIISNDWLVSNYTANASFTIQSA